MDAKAKAVREILHSGDQFLVPFFQRSYSWQKKHWRRLWGDLLALLEDSNRKHHFLGPLVCASLKSQPGEVHAFQLIDGQQRLTTLSLLLAAVRDATLRVGNEELAAEISETYLVNRFKKGPSRYKIVPRLGDRDIYFALADGKPEESDNPEGISEAHRFFTKAIKTDGFAKVEKLSELFETIVGRLHLVVITLDQENPYEIFESLNSTGLPLQESDLIRNFLFMQLPVEQHEDFQQEHWRQFEKLFDPEGEFKALPATKFYREYLMRNGRYSRAGDTFVDFKTYYLEAKLSSEKAVAELTQFVSFALAIARKGQGMSEPVAKAIRRFELLEATTATPLLLNLMGRYSANKLSEVDLLGMFDDLTSFILRRSFCGETTRTYGRWFCEAIGALGDDPRKDLQSYLAHRGWPDDEAFTRSAQEFPAYRRELKKVRLILESIEESFGHKEKVDLAPLQVEHVMPQKLSQGPKGEAWRKMLGENWAKTHKLLLHTLGNLTLTGYNPNLSNKPYAEKRVELVNSKLCLNEFFKDTEDWNADFIVVRSEELARKAAEMWPRPKGIKEYTPSHALRSAVPRAGRERRHAYWGKLIAMLTEQNSPWLPLEATGGTALELALPTEVAKLSVRYLFNQRRFEILLKFTRRRGKKMFAELKKDRSIIDECFEQNPVWGNDKESFIRLRKEGCTIKDPLDWHEQHTWIVARMTEFHAAFFRRLQDLDSLVQESSPLRSLFLDYWTELRTLMDSREGRVRATKPPPQYWYTFSVGRSNFTLNAFASTRGKRVGVDLTIGGKMAKDHFHELKKDQQAIEKEIGSKLEWLESPRKQQSRIVINRKDCDLSDREKWPEQLDWIRTQLEVFHRAFHDRVKQLNSSNNGKEKTD